MVVGIYAFFDVVADKIIGVSSASSDGAVIRDNAAVFQRINPQFKQDIRVYKIGSVAESDMVVTPEVSPKFVSWDIYSSHPESDSPVVMEVKK